MNGGIWFSHLERDQQQLALSLLDACRDLPHIIEITCANGLNVIAHAIIRPRNTVGKNRLAPSASYGTATG